MGSLVNKLYQLNCEPTREQASPACEQKTTSENRGIRSTRKLQLVHSNVYGPVQTESISGQRYFVTFIDDASQCCAVYFLKRKSEVFEKFKEFEALVTNECGQNIVTLHTDVFQQYLSAKGIRHELTTPYPNGVAQRTNKTLMESARASCKSVKQLLGRGSSDCSVSEEQIITIRKYNTVPEVV